MSYASNLGFDSVDNKKGAEYLKNIAQKYGIFKECLDILEQQFKGVLEYNFLLENTIVDMNRFFKNFIQPFKYLIQLKNSKEYIDEIGSFYSEKIADSKKILQKILKKKSKKCSLHDTKSEVEKIQNILEEQSMTLKEFQSSYSSFQKFN